ncbi:protein phosphatase 1, regulatory (inhibitor) subunit 1B, isoform CRA_b [Rattus norvegicus]|uniref:Protein phosphatase 1, regulatory (Inhibitor) subunit 1B, isoform CRA_b n=1 Tax=Rattus norvegicus TaxID=10116 RepID=A6HIR5_RAT|nr:protein phosphatase 1, regulatory (inhibitor) subunit 1B, isoform CRA_b [Rattus norvegicus]
MVRCPTRCLSCLSFPHLPRSGAGGQPLPCCSGSQSIPRQRRSPLRTREPQERGTTQSRRDPTPVPTLPHH